MLITIYNSVALKLNNNQKIEFMIKKSVFSICALLFASMQLFASEVVALNPKPFVIPELREWSGDVGTFEINKKSKLLYSACDKGAKEVVEEFAKDYMTMFGVKVVPTQSAGTFTTNDVVFELVRDSSLGEEGYLITIGNGVSVKAQTAQGLYWATRSLLQMIESTGNGLLPRGSVKDWPDYAVRGMLMDCARMWIPLEFLENYIDIMSYYKMNTLHIHLNDNGLARWFDEDWDMTYSAFRLESEKFPGLTAQDGHYTKQEFKDLQRLALRKGITVIPEIDVPGHSLAFTHYRKDLASDYQDNYLNLFNEDTYEFVDALFDEYLGGDDPVFIGKRVHIGTDEYKIHHNLDKEEQQKVVEKFRYFCDRYLKYVESYGKRPCMWGSLTEMSGETEVKVDGVDVFIWNNPYGDPGEHIKAGYNIVNIPESNYIVPTAPYYFDYLNHEKIYKEWTPAVVADQTFEDQHPSILGGMFAVWNDRIQAGVSLKDIHDRAMPATQVISAKTWSGANTTIEFDEYEQNRSLLSEAPGLNYGSKHGEPNSIVYEAKVVKPNSTLPIEEIGYGYTISFDLDGVVEEAGTVLFESEHAKFYIADPVKGLFGFSRDGHIRHFKISTFNKKKTNIMIQGDNASTSIYVDGEFAQILRPYTHYTHDEVYKMQIISTLVFPLAKTGNFKSKVTNLKVYNYILDTEEHDKWKDRLRK